jgi:hypothetical protein
MAKELRGSSPTTTRYETEAEREHPGTSRYKNKKGVDPPNLTNPRLPNSLPAKHRGPTLA